MSEAYIDDPIELPNGKWVCRRHRLGYCYKCCVDYTFMDEDEDEDEDEDDFHREYDYRVNEGEDVDDSIPFQLPDGRLVCYKHHRMVCDDCGDDWSFTARPGWEFRSDDDEDDDSGEVEDITAQRRAPAVVFNGMPEGPRRGTGSFFASKFKPPSADTQPVKLFASRMIVQRVARFILTGGSNETMTVIHTDGACLNNGQANPRAGWGFFHGVAAGDGKLLTCSGRLEKQGPFGGDETVQTSNRAELRAVLAALRFRHWPSEGFRAVVIATDSEYVVEGSTTWAKTWIQNKWHTRSGLVKNKDLWEAVLGEIEEYKKKYGMEVMFWRIPREWNTIADAAAKEAAASDEQPDEYRDAYGVKF